MRFGLPFLALFLACGGSSSQDTTAPAPQSAPAQHASAEHGEHGEHGGHHKGHGGDREYRQHKMPHNFRGAEDWAKRFDNPERDQWQKPDAVIAAMKLSPGMVVADIGAGTGYFEPHLSKAVGDKGKVLALDIEKDMVRYLGERAKRESLTNVEARVISPSSPELQAASVDRVLTVNTWHHIGERKAYAGKVASALKPGGALVVVDFFPRSKKGPPKKHKLAPSTVAAELSAAGLEVQLLLEILPEQYIVVGNKKP
jgi:ubiquinone/menaquinone biosynthesis C-methylase UbiE